jgi:hypothetical protein
MKETPLLFEIPAWIFSRLDLLLSPVETRVLPFITVLGTVFITIWHILRRTRLYASLVLMTAFIGVAGSGLVMARYEYVQELNILCCLIVLCNTVLPNKSFIRYGFFALLILSSLFSVYSHMQGLLFLPLTIFLAYQLILPSLRKSYALILMTALLLIIAKTGFEFHHSTCSGYPQIELFWEEMTFQWKAFDIAKLMDWSKINFDMYQQSFIYNKNYAINYLPGIVINGELESIFLSTLNKGIQIVLLVNLLLTLGIAIGIPLGSWRYKRVQQGSNRSWMLKDILFSRLVQNKL